MFEPNQTLNYNKPKLQHMHTFSVQVCKPFKPSTTLFLAYMKLTSLQQKKESNTI